MIVTQVHPPKSSITQVAQVRSVQQGIAKPSPPANAQQPQTIDLTSQPKPAKVIELNAPKPKVIELNRVPQPQNRPLTNVKASEVRQQPHPNQQTSKILQGGTPNSQQPTTRTDINSVPKRKLEVVSGGVPQAQGSTPPPAKRQQLTVEEVRPATQPQQTTQAASQTTSVTGMVTDTILSCFFLVKKAIVHRANVLFYRSL